MGQQEKQAYKAGLKKWALDHLGRRIATVKESMQQAQEAANSEEKSSAGDKYETGRAMGHLQKEMHARQLAELVREMAALHAVNDTLLRADSFDFFIGIGLGKQTVEGRVVIFLSPQAPLARTLQNIRPGDSFVFQQQTVCVREIF